MYFSDQRPYQVPNQVPVASAAENFWQWLEKERDQYDVENLTEIEELFAAKKLGLEASASTLPDYQGNSSGTIQTGSSSFGINSCAEASGRFQECLQLTVQLIED